jgi:hypothetical protein
MSLNWHSRKLLLYLLLLIGICLGLNFLDPLFIAWIETPVPMQDVLERPILTGVFNFLHLKWSDSVAKVQILSDTEDPKIGLTVRIDMNGIDATSIFADEWTLAVARLTSADRLPFEITQSIPFAIRGDWWDVMPIHDRDRLWQLQSPLYQYVCTAIVRPRLNGSTIYIVTNDFNLHELPPGLWPELKMHWIRTGIVPSPGGDYGGVWKQ